VADRSVSVPMTLNEWHMTRISRSTFRQSYYNTCTNRKPYLTYRMVPCLVTLTDIWTRRAGLSASAELFVVPLSNFTQKPYLTWSKIIYWIRSHNHVNKKLSWCWQRARRVCRSVEVNKHFGSIPSKIIKNNSE